MNRGRIHRGGNVHEFQAKSAWGQLQLADIANQGDVGVVNSHRQVGLVALRGGLLGNARLRGAFLLSSCLSARLIGRHQRRGYGQSDDRDGRRPAWCGMFRVLQHFHGSSSS